jgi:hypothetical protein
LYEQKEKNPPKKIFRKKKRNKKKREKFTKKGGNRVERGDRKKKPGAGILEQSMMVSNRVGIGLSYQPTGDGIFKLLQESIPRNRFHQPM